MKLNIKKYDFEFIELNKMSTSNYKVGEYGIGKEPLKAPSSQFNRIENYKFGTILNKGNLNNLGKIGSVASVLDLLKPENTFYYFELYKDVRYGETYKEVIKLLQETLMTSSQNGEIEHFDIELSFENGIGDIDINEGAYIYDPFDNPSYKIRVDIPNKGLTPKEFKDFKEKAEKKLKERNYPSSDIKRFNDKSMETPPSSNSFDYNDVPSNGGGGGGGGGIDRNRRKTAIV